MNALLGTVSNIKNTNNTFYKTNCGLAHGHISYIIILSEYLNNFPEDQFIKFTIENSVKCVLDFESSNENSLFMFPSMGINRYNALYNIHLGWCYGDQCVSIGLLKASKALNNTHLYKKAEEIATNTLRRDSCEKAFLSNNYDAGLCHGTTSVAYLHKIWFNETKNSNFLNLYNYFLEQTIKLSNKEDGIAGYKKNSEKNQFTNAIGLIDGITGIGIILLDSILENKTNEWKDFLIL